MPENNNNNNNYNNNSGKRGIPNPFGNKNDRKKDGGKFSWSLFYILVTVALIGVYFFTSGDAVREVNDMEFYQMVKVRSYQHSFVQILQKLLTGNVENVNI